MSQPSSSPQKLLGPLLLCILDGVGLNPNREGNAVALANTPTLDRLFNSFPHSTLTTHGRAVGLPEGQMGNSEVGHLNIGAGRVVKQWLLRIDDAFSLNELDTSPTLRTFNERMKENPSASIHLVGLCSFGGVHSSLHHLFSLIPLLSRECPDTKFVLHLISDGRDVPPKQFEKDLAEIERHLLPFGDRISLGSLSGRYYAMDRDNRWNRTEEAYHAMAGANGKLATHPGTLKAQFETATKLVHEFYVQNITDEFFPPRQLTPFTLHPSDGVIFWNFRSDRMRQIVKAFAIEPFDGFLRKASIVKKDHTLCFAEYDQTFHLPVLFPTEQIEKSLGEVLSLAGLTQLRAAETEKYPHVTYFLNGGEERVFSGEDRVLVPSPRDVKTYDEKPEMSALPLTSAVLSSIMERKHDCIILNFANGDMVGHTGVLDAAIKAVETVDSCLGRLLEEIEKQNGAALIIADHGNAELMIDPVSGGPHTAHTTFPVPVILFGEVAKTHALQSGGALCDVAPTVLEILGLEQPTEMTGKSLLTKR